jgi:polar amino acid transport system substrate-binding protein
VPGVRKTIGSIIRIVVVLVWLFPSPSLAQETPVPAARVVVATRILPPFILKEGEAYVGFSAELWLELAARLNIEFDWLERNNIVGLLEAVSSGEAQAGIAAISVTAEREQKFDFSQPMFDSGLQVMVRAEAEAGHSWRTVLGYFTSGAMPYLLGVLALLTLIPGHAVWFVERGHKDSPFSRSYFPGVFQAMGWALSAAAGQQNDSPRTKLGRFLSILAIFLSLMFLTYWQAELTSSFTVQQLQGGINGPDDLPGQKVGTTAGSTASKWASGAGARVTEHQTIAQSFAALEKGDVDAVVFDAPVLLYHAATAGRGKVRVVGTIFRKESYGILFPQDSELRKRVNEALLTMREDGSYDRLYRKWFEPADP